ncbi:MAG: EamA family transporter [Bacillota bacterium]
MRAGLDPTLLGALLGSLSLIGWGTLDFLLKVMMGRVHSARVFAWMQAWGIPILALASWLLGGTLPPADMTGHLTLLAFLYLAANLTLFRALAVGEVSVVTPITASWSMAAALFGSIFLGDRLLPLQWAAVVGNVAGVLLVSTGSGDQAVVVVAAVAEQRPAVVTAATQHGTAAAAQPAAPVRQRRALAPGAGWALGSLAVFALMNTFLKPVSQAVGPVETSLWMKVPTAIGALAYIWVVRPRDPEEAPGPVRQRWFLLIAALEAGAGVAYNLGVTVAAVGVVAPVSASSPILTIGLAAYFLKEPLSRRQWYGIALIVVSLVVLSTGGA